MTSIAPADYAKQLHFDAPGEKVLGALTSPDGLASWWAPVTGCGTEDGELQFTFGPGQTLVVHVAEASYSAVRWQVTACDFMPDWVGTSPTFVLGPWGAAGTELRFRHEGLRPQLECYETCWAGWDHYLPSLQAYVESGAGWPIVGE